jgi:hypothetical protein
MSPPCRVPILSQGCDLGISRDLAGDADLEMNPFK